MQCGKENISGNIAAGKGIENMKKDKLKSLDLRYFGSIQYTIDSVFHNDFYCHKQACVSKIFVI